MANAEHLTLLLDQDGATQIQPVYAWNRWREENPSVTLDLSGANLRGANMCGADLRRVNLRRADLRATDLREANLIAADLSRADLNWANLTGANLREATLIGADLSRANLSSASLYGANLSGVDLSGAEVHETDFGQAILFRTVFANIDLRGAKGLETADSRGPCSIDVDTIYVSEGRIPQTFLRGSGVPDNFISYISSLVGRAIEFYSCFISYSTKDQEFAHRLHADLESKGVRCWFAPNDIKGGRKLHEQIDEAIRLHERLLLILSAASMESEWVKTEIAKARRRESKEQRRVLFPVRLVSFEYLRDWECFDADSGKDSAREIREYYIPDFSQWQDPDSYQYALKRLITDLKTESQHTTRVESHVSR